MDGEMWVETPEEEEEVEEDSYELSKCINAASVKSCRDMVKMLYKQPTYST